MSMSIAEAKSQFSAVVDRAAAGEEIVLTRHGKPVAKLVPLALSAAKDVEAMVRRMREGRTATIGMSDWKELRDFGRRF